MNLITKTKKKLRWEYTKYTLKNKPKIFCIGRNKTGTTSLKAAMKDLGYVVGNEKAGHRLVFDWGKRDFGKLIEHCKTGQFFQDVPFSRAYTFIVLDHVFPNSKFILTVRDSPEQWFDSLVRYETKKRGKNGNPPTKEDLKNHVNFYKGRDWDVFLLSNNADDKLYDKKRLTEGYKRHNANIKKYFRNRPEDLLVLNVAEKGAYQKLCDFLGKETDQTEFPWKNKT